MHNEDTLGMGHKSKHKLLLCFIYTLYTQAEVNVNNIFNNSAYETKFVSHPCPPSPKVRLPMLQIQILPPFLITSGVSVELFDNFNNIFTLQSRE